jgi:hypothetical protein
MSGVAASFVVAAIVVWTLAVLLYREARCTAQLRRELDEVNADNDRLRSEMLRPWWEGER